MATLREWAEGGGICIIGFEAFLALTTRNASAPTAGPLLQDPGADIVVLDEGHRIKNVKGKQHGECGPPSGITPSLPPQ